jgi:predicted phage baseplate assembly protein
MSGLAPDLFDRRFQDFLEIGRARLRSLAPAWTDHNAHDPGITLMELLAWVSEAQVYSLSRVRRDERAAYAALLGLAPHGTQPASGLLWPDRNDPASPFASHSKSRVIPEDAAILMAGTDGPTFRPERRLLWVPGRITRVEARRTGGVSTDLTSANRRGDTPFLPFGERAGRRDVLAITYAANDEAGVFGADRQSAKGASLSIGVMAAPPIGGAPARATESSDSPRTSITATIVSGDERFPAPITLDTTDGLLATGVLLLDVEAVAGSPREITIELRAPRGFSRPPRLLRVEPNVVPMRQGRDIVGELHVANGRPDWSFQLDVPGLRFDTTKEPVRVKVSEPTGVTEWTRRDRLSDHGPTDDVFELDAADSRITFGNGINGRMPSAESQVLVSYAVSDAEQGDVARNRRWEVAGFKGVFGVNPEPVTGGDAPSSGGSQRRDARRIAREEHALVSASDIAGAALELPLLEVARAWVTPVDSLAPRTGVVRLIAMRSRSGSAEADEIPETPRWLEAIRRRLSVRMPLGSRLVVEAPRYVSFSIDATIEAVKGRDPESVRVDVERALASRLALVSDGGRARRREPGTPVTRRDVAAWMRGLDGVGRIADLQLLDAGGRGVTEITVPRSGLPRWMAGASAIRVARPAAGARR